MPNEGVLPIKSAMYDMAQDGVNYFERRTMLHLGLHQARCEMSDWTATTLADNYLRLCRCPSFLLQRGSTWVNLVLGYLPRQYSMPHVCASCLAHVSIFLWALEQAMPTLRAMEALTLQTLFWLFNTQGSSSKCCSSVALCDTLPCSGWLFLVFSAKSHLFHDVLSDMSVNPDHKSFVKKVPGFLLFRSHQRARSLYPNTVSVFSIR